MKARKIVEEMDSYVPGRSQDEIAQDFNLKKETISDILRSTHLNNHYLWV